LEELELELRLWFELELLEELELELRLWFELELLEELELELRLWLELELPVTCTVSATLAVCGRTTRTGVRGAGSDEAATLPAATRPIAAPIRAA
jgi:hypothetical protein